MSHKRHEENRKKNKEEARKATPLSPEQLDITMFPEKEGEAFVTLEFKTLFPSSNFFFLEICFHAANCEERQNCSQRPYPGNSGPNPVRPCKNQEPSRTRVPGNTTCLSGNHKTTHSQPRYLDQGERRI